MRKISELLSLSKGELVEIIIGLESGEGKEEKRIKEKDSYITELEEQVKVQEEKINKYVQFLRDVISAIGDQPEVLEGDGEEEPKTEPKSDRELESELADAMKKLKALEDKDKTREDAAKAEKEAYELQARLEPLLAVILVKEKYVPFAELIREEVTDEDGRIKAEDDINLGYIVEKAFDRINEIRSAELKALIIKEPKEEARMMMDLDKLREKFPELVKQIEDEKVVALKKERARKKKSATKKK